MNPGDTISVSITLTKIPPIKATVLSVEGDAVRVRYADDAEVFAGLIGLIRLPRGSDKGQNRQGRPRKERNLTN